MRCAMLIWPHANARYREAIRPLAERELLLTLLRVSPDADPASFGIGYTDLAGVDALCFDLPEASPEAFALLSRHSALYLLCTLRPDGALLPVQGPAPACLGEDLSGILKYKGKTNERFTRFLLNCAMLLCRAEIPAGERPLFGDPMCGRGTAVFEALNLGWNAFGSDIDAADVNEAASFYKRYLEYHRRKHSQKTASMTIPRGGSASVRAIAAQGAGEARFAVCDAADLAYVCGRNSLHVAAADLPYGIQHAPGAGRRMSTMEDLLRRALPGMAASLRPGGVAALSFNVNTLPRASVLREMEAAGLEPCVGPLFEGLEHWVEQAVTRDCCFARKPLRPTNKERIKR